MSFLNLCIWLQDILKSASDIFSLVGYNVVWSGRFISIRAENSIIAKLKLKSCLELEPIYIITYPCIIQIIISKGSQFSSKFALKVS